MTIFVVDDESVIASTLGIILRSHQFDVKVFFDGETALAAASSCRPDLLLTDIAMGKMSGLELSTSLRTLHSECPVLFFSAHTQTTEFVFDGVPEGVWRMIEKPVHPLALVETISSMCANQTGLYDGLRVEEADPGRSQSSSVACYEAPYA